MWNTYVLPPAMPPGQDATTTEELTAVAGRHLFLAALAIGSLPASSSVASAEAPRSVPGKHAASSSLGSGSQQRAQETHLT
eukprot:CAMPEP_0195106516 /NCGR_PEP_ID=MMETSP0448-20130528/81033_1 /TAXON_ID=66468 /ORGANISM="Heterocapsa triquestra, Strain CCMP 448" /LENGTH=80 /DNA_ID=CAMNT_0040142787 /DNA_START=34 /DNA_END=273 /DNA_ORIENTATION=+